jgi:acyl-coenzyme A synthetase/AMP-(fatty) acid ligase
MNHRTFHHESVANPSEFWLKQATSLSWYRFPQSGLSQGAGGLDHWFEDGKINMSYLCLDYNIFAGREHQAALIYDSPVTGTRQKLTYAELKSQVARFASGLLSQGIKKGDTVVIYMPMIPQAVIAMLACARIGAIHSVVFGGFAPHELAVRIQDCRARAVITATYGVEVDRKIHYLPLLMKAIDESPYKPPVTIVYRREPGEEVAGPLKTVDFDSLLQSEKEAEPVKLRSTDPLYILYTSGTTGKPKGVLRDTGGYATALKFSMENIYNVRKGEVFFAASDLGWVVGHSFIVYGPLIQGCTTVLYEGKPVRTPDAGAFWRLVEEHRISVMFAAPTALRAIRKEDPEGELFASYDVSSLRSLFLAGERCDVATHTWIKQLLRRPVIDHWWQTESGWPMLGIMSGLEQVFERAGSAGFPVCGYKIEILGDTGEVLEAGREGLIAVKRPLPPGFMMDLWNSENGFYTEYLSRFGGYYISGDGGYKDQDGYFFVTGRVDDVINVAGHRLSTGEMEEVISTHPSVAECAVVAVSDDLKGHLPLAFVILKDWQIIAESELQKNIMSLIREKIGAVASLKEVILLKRLPKTRSGKILRKTLRAIVDGVEYTTPSTIEDPIVLEEVCHRLEELNIKKKYA